MLRTPYIILVLLITGWAGSAGANTQLEPPCGIETCDGLEITCGPNVPRMCAASYRLGDFCREYVRCKVIAGACQIITDPRFPACKTCVQSCSGSVGPDAFKCEAACREMIGQNNDPVWVDEPEPDSEPAGSEN
jgi:hypothetical protein